jgi:hypothetical protein
MTVLEITLAKVKVLVASGAVTEVDVQLAIDEVEFVICNYCNIEETSDIPEALSFTWANMAADLLKYTYETNRTDAGAGGTTEVDESEVSSIKIGDTQISLGGSGSASQRSRTLRSHVAVLDQLTMNHREQLNKFRRVVW